MMPISVRDNSAAIQMGYNRANDTVNRFNTGLNDASKGFEKSVIIGRLKSEEDEYMKRQRLEKAIADNDTEAIRQMLQDPWYKKLWNGLKDVSKIDGPGFTWKSQIDRDLENADFTAMPNKLTIPKKEGEYHFNIPDGGVEMIKGGSSGEISLMPNSLNRNDFLINKARQRVNDYDNRIPTTVARAAETAGIQTGYIPASGQDKMNIEQQERNFESYVKDYSQATLRRNGIAATLANYEALAANGALSPEQQTIVKDLRHQYESLNATIRNIKDEGIKAGVPERRFLIEAEGTAPEASQESDRINWTNEATNAGLPNNKKMSEAEVQAFLIAKGIDVSDPKIKHVTQKQNENYAAWHSTQIDAQSRKAGSVSVEKAVQEFAGVNATNASKLNSLKSIRNGSNLDKANYLKMAVDTPAFKVAGVDLLGIADLFTDGKISEQAANKQETVLNAKLDELIAGLQAQTGNGRGRM
jgi:hypothetical protein